VAGMMRLWDDGADTLVLCPEEMQQLSSSPRTPSLHQHMQSVVRGPDDVGIPSMLS
jgi:hypothetical protein